MATDVWPVGVYHDAQIRDPAGELRLAAGIVRQAERDSRRGEPQERKEAREWLLERGGLFETICVACCDDPEHGRRTVLARCGLRRDTTVTR
jgi:hypothetical protein